MQLPRGERRMVNSELIKKRAKALGFTQGDLAAALYIKQSSMNLKINNRRPMTLPEAEALADLLRITSASFGTYFFWDDCRKPLRVTVRQVKRSRRRA